MPVQFKSYINVKSVYQGGKGRSEIQGSGKKIYKLSSNENPLGASPLALAAIEKHISKVSEYPERKATKLRKALVEYYEGTLNLDHFICANSGVAIIELLIRAFLEVGDEVIYSNPAFGPYRVFPKKYGAKAIDIPLIGDHFHLDVEGILAAIGAKTKVVFITNPNNPTGTHLPKEQIESLIKQLPDHVLLVFDEVYYQFADAEDYIRALPFVKAGKNVIAINSFSKAYGLAGLRIGYAYSTPEIASYLREFNRPFLINTLSMEAAIAALKDQDFIERTVSHVHKEKYFLYEELDKIGCKYWKTQANFILIEPKISGLDFEKAMLDEGVMIRPVSNFGALGAVRVTIGTREANEVFLKVLGNLK